MGITSKKLAGRLQSTSNHSPLWQIQNDKKVSFSEGVKKQTRRKPRKDRINLVDGLLLKEHIKRATEIAIILNNKTKKYCYNKFGYTCNMHLPKYRNIINVIDRMPLAIFDYGFSRKSYHDLTDNSFQCLHDLSIILGMGPKFY